MFVKGFFLVSISLFFGLLGSFSWFSFWLVFELLSWTFLSLLAKEEDSFFGSSSLWKFFFYQFLSSSIFLLSFIFSSNQNFDSFFLQFMFFCSMLMKLGVPPFHGWVIQISENIPFNSFFFINFFQKFGPVLVFSNFMDFSSFFVFAILVLILGSVGGWNLFSTHRFLVYSSIMNLGWAVSCLFTSKLLFLSYYFSYSLVFWFFFWFLEKMNESSMNTPSHTPQGVLSKMFFLVSVMNIMGVPPVCLFFLKYISIKMVASQGLLLLSIFMVFFTAVFIYMYLCVFSTQFFSKLDVMKKHSSGIPLFFGFCYFGLTFFACFS